MPNCINVLCVQQVRKNFIYQILPWESSPKINYVRNWGYKDCPKTKKKEKSASLLPKLTITDAIWFLKLWGKYLLNLWGKK